MKTCHRSRVKKPVRVLVAEASRDESDGLVRQLRRSHLEGHVKMIPDGRQAWNFLAGEGSRTRLIAIFVDLHLPYLSGLKLLCRIKSHPQLRHIPVVVMTSSREAEELRECVRLGVDGYLVKPVTFAAFTKAVADVFHGAPSRVLAQSE